MRISIIGTGYVGLSTGVGFAVKGNEVVCVDINREKVDNINKGVSPIYEPLLDDYLKKVLKEKKFRATTDLKEAIEGTSISFISVGTPSREDGSIDLKYVEEVSKRIGEVLKDKEYHVVVVKSTVVPETTEKVVIPNLEKSSGKRAGEDFGVCMNPEFLKEGKAMEDFLKPDRVVVGAIDNKSGDVIGRLYENFHAPVLRTDLKTAEMIKYASNALLATKISFSNEIGNICKKLGINVNEVMKGVGLDSRVTGKFLGSGCGYGGSCFTKDVDALIWKAKDLGYEPKLLQEVHDLNLRQKVKLVEQLEKKVGGLKGKTVCVLGLAFKPDSDDIREASSIPVISKLLEKGARVKAYDPEAGENMRKVFPDVEYAETAKDAIKDSDACLIVTEWKEFGNLSDRDFETMKNKVVIEGRKVLDRNRVSEFDGICW
ncbi:MAG: UDP-glucose/GDP-mannose dehydrogenase family protein [Candidatus Aenigmatarchaeota archaeon]|nr:MAG: UDP-glucose/GDP-mannose dehydrogenase family protein [Candidatus Aenigmarchaeota archaeon]